MVIRDVTDLNMKSRKLVKTNMAARGKFGSEKSLKLKRIKSIKNLHTQRKLFQPCHSNFASGVVVIQAFRSPVSHGLNDQMTLQSSLFQRLLHGLHSFQAHIRVIKTVDAHDVSACKQATSGQTAITMVTVNHIPDACQKSGIGNQFCVEFISEVYGRSCKLVILFVVIV